MLGRRMPRTLARSSRYRCTTAVVWLSSTGEFTQAAVAYHSAPAASCERYLYTPSCAAARRSLKSTSMRITATGTWPATRVSAGLGDPFQIIQGPLGGVATQRLTAAVSNYGGLGSFGAVGLRARREIDDVSSGSGRSPTSRSR